MGYELKDNKCAKPTKKKEEKSASKENAPSRSGSAKRLFSPEFKGSRMDLNDFMAQMLDSMQKLHVKVDNVGLLFVEKKM